MFMPFKLNADMLHFKDQIQYLSSDNGVDLYKAKEGFKTHLLGFAVSKINLYFFEGSLITIYIRFHKNAGDLSKLKSSLEKVIQKQAKLIETDTGYVHYWQIDDQFLGLMIQDKERVILLYNSLNKFNIFNQYL